MVSMKDVAQRAKVSVSTVSAVINGLDCVRPATRERVLDAVSELGYVLNHSARGLASRKSMNVGLVSMLYQPSQQDPTANAGVGELSYYPFINKIVECFENNDYGILLENFSYAPNSDALPTIVEQNRVDGVFVLGSLYAEAFIAQLKQRLNAVVAVGCTSVLTDYVQSDYAESIQMSVDYLVARGHRRIAYACGDSLTSAYPYKLQGYMDGLAKAGIPLDASLLFPSLYSLNAGYAIGQKICTLPESAQPTALVCASDVLAAGAYRHFIEAGLRIPKDISVIGYENIAIGGYLTPALTTVDWHKDRMGREASRIMLERLKNPHLKTQRVVVPCSILERDSVATLG